MRSNRKNPLAVLRECTLPSSSRERLDYNHLFAAHPLRQEARFCCDPNIAHTFISMRRLLHGCLCVRREPCCAIAAFRIDESASGRDWHEICRACRRRAIPQARGGSALGGGAGQGIVGNPGSRCRNRGKHCTNATPIATSRRLRMQNCLRRHLRWPRSGRIIAYGRASLPPAQLTQMGC